MVAQAASQGTPECPVRSFEDASTWPDCVRERHISRLAWLTPMHFEDIPYCGHRPKSAYCPEGRCVTEETKRGLAVLRNHRLPAVERLQALEEVTHFVGDLHQPLHVADNGDRGGNEVLVIFEGRATNLHHIWDTELVRKAVFDRSENAAVGQLRPLVSSGAPGWSSGDVDTWAAETHRIAAAFVYPMLAHPPACRERPPGEMISATYVQRSGPIIREQLAKAAVRLAAVLNRAM